MTKVIYFIFVSILLCSCNMPSSKKDGDSIAVLDLDIKSDSVPAIADVKYIPLETNEECLISGISKIIYRNNTFYIFDKQGKAVFLFDKQGFFVRKVHALGGGPEEYMEPTDMDVDKEGNIYVADNPTHRIIMYPQNREKEVRVIDVGKYFLEFAVADSNFIYLSDVVIDRKMGINLARFNRQDKQLEIIEKSDFSESGTIPRFARNYFYRSDNQLYYYKRFSPYIYQICGEKAMPHLKIESQWYPTHDKMEQWKVAGPQSVINDYKYIRDISACYETDNSVFIVSQTTPSFYTIIDKRTKHVYNFPSFKDERVSDCLHVFSSDSHSYVSVCFPTDKIIQRITSSTDSIGRKRLEASAEDSNPILVLFSFR